MIIDDLSAMKKLDASNMLGSLERLGDQLTEVAKEVAALKLPAGYKKIKNIVVLGMGGSALGAHLAKFLYASEFKVPFEIVNNYELPKFVNSETLVLAVAYSGTTEEPLAAVAEAYIRRAKIIAITTGKDLGEWAAQRRLPTLIFSTKNNPSGQPRMGLGYTLFGQLLIYARLGLISFTKSDLNRSIKTLSAYQQKFGPGVPLARNRAKQLAVKTAGQSVWFAAAGHLTGSAHVAANQINENAKRFGAYFLIPELNHHLLEGMIFPASNRSTVLFVLLKSDLYHPRIRKRFEITRRVLDKNKIKSVQYLARSKSRLEQVAEVLVLSGYLSFYSAMLEGIDPSPIPFVDYFKAQLK